MNESEELQRHIGSCNAMRMVTLWCAIVLVTFNFIIILFMTGQTFMIKGRQDRMVSWMDTADNMRAADLRALADRIYITDKRF